MSVSTPSGPALHTSPAMKLSRAATYAVLAVAQLPDGVKSTPVPCRRLAELGDMPERFLLQILRALVNAGLLQSTRGVIGGYRLARPAATISVLDVIEAVQGPIQPEPLDGVALPANVAERIQGALAAGAADQRRHLGQISIADVRILA